MDEYLKFKLLKFTKTVTYPHRIKYQLQSISIKTNVYNNHTSSSEKHALITRLNMTKQYS